MIKLLILGLVGISLAITAGAVESRSEETTAVGETMVVVRDVTGLLGKDLRQLQMQDNVYFDEVIESGEDSATEITFQDNTTLTIGPNSRITLDSVVFDPDPDASKFVLSITKGLLRLTTGQLPSSAYEVHTPVATIGVRGTVLNVIVTESQE